VTDRAKAVATTLNRLVGTLHAARCTAVLWIRHAEDPKYLIAAKYGLQMTFGTTVLTLRKFQDLWIGGQLQALIPEGTEARNIIEWVLHECDQHKTRDAANLLFAHYAKCIKDPPLSERENRALVEAGGWTMEEEVVEWSGAVIDKLRLVRDDLMSRYAISTLADDEATA